MIKLLLSQDFIIKIKYIFIFTIINRLIKYIYIKFYIENNTSKNLTYIFLKIIIINHNVPKEIILDKDKFFYVKILDDFYNIIRSQKKTIN
jgi:hypothetical protein